MSIILASESPYRKELLERLNLSFRTCPAHIDEESIWNTDLSPLEVSLELSKLKAKKVFSDFPKSIVIGSDQVIALGNQVFGKPMTETKAVQQLIELQGKTHQLITSVCILSESKEVTFSNTANLMIRAELTRDEIENYVKHDRPLNCAGSYKIEGMGIALFEKVETNDFTSIIGLPLIELTKNLREFGIGVLK